MGRNYNEKSILKTKVIKNVLLNEKDYTFQDFKFKVVIEEKEYKYWKSKEYFVEVYNFDVLILKIKYNKMSDNLFSWQVVYFNGQTNNDCQSINHIIAVFKELCPADEKHEDKGNANLINNQYIFRRKENFYSYVRVWVRGDINNKNYDKDLSLEFASEEYINYIKKIFGFKRMPRRNLKKKIKDSINKAIILEKKRLLLENLTENDS